MLDSPRASVDQPTTAHLAPHSLWRACLHEYAHLVVARHFGGAGFVTILRGRSDGSRFGGRFQLHGELADDEWRIVALAGAVAERFDVDPGVDADTLVAALRGDSRWLAGVDAALAAGFVESDVTECLRIVRLRWHEIAGEAAERAASGTVGD